MSIPSKSNNKFYSGRRWVSYLNPNLDKRVSMYQRENGLKRSEAIIELVRIALDKPKP